MQRHTITNRRGQKISLLFEDALPKQGLAFITHGFSGFKEQPHIAKMAECFLAHNVSTVRFDATHAFGESDGDLAEATLTKHADDLEDVIIWAQQQPWYQEPFYLAGHSLGGAASLRYASLYPSKVKAMAPTSCVISGALLLAAYQQNFPETLLEIARNGFSIKQSSSKPGASGKVTQAYMDNLGQHDYLATAARYTMPTLLVVGTADDTTLPEHQKLLYQALPGHKTYHEIHGASHTFKSPKELSELGDIFDKWLQEINA
jgi:pimeloyl-ACP methyl ester carboxylesterase